MKFIKMTDEIQEYMNIHNPILHPALKELRDITAQMPRSQMQISHEQGVFLNFMAGTLQAKRILEIGCFTGYSAISMALALPQGGELHTLDIDPETTKIAQNFFKKTGVDQKVTLHLGDAKETLSRLSQKYGAASFDMAFIDADKTSMYDYFTTCLSLVRRGGVIICDNVLWNGSVCDRTDQSQDTQAIRRFNQLASQDHRVAKSFISIADGLFLLRVL